MSLFSSIEWTDSTWNPVRGCTKISPGCAHCYAETFAERFRGVKGHPYEQGFDLRLVPEKLFEPLQWPSPKMVFVNSMSDLFHDGIPDWYIQAVTRVMTASPWNIYQVLTKRASRMRELLTTALRQPIDLDHIWWGVSVENRKYGVPRLEALRSSPVAMRFISAEPLLECIGEFDLTGISWVIVGGESGRGARPINTAWVTSIMEQCQNANVPFFFKQWGGVNKKRSGRQLNGRVYDSFPEITRAPIPERAERLKLIANLRQEFAPCLSNLASIS